jgi:hypothetical protein
MELVSKAEFSIVTRASRAWIPELIASAGPEVTETYIDFFTSTIRNRNTRLAYARACWQSFDWCAAHGLELTTVRPFHVAAWIEDFPGSKPTIKQKLGCGADAVRFSGRSANNTVESGTRCPRAKVCRQERQNTCLEPRNPRFALTCPDLPAAFMGLPNRD